MAGNITRQKLEAARARISALASNRPAKAPSMSPFIDTMRVHYDEIAADRDNRHTWDEIAMRYWRREPRPCRRTLLRLLQQVQGERSDAAKH